MGLKLNVMQLFGIWSSEYVLSHNWSAKFQSTTVKCDSWVQATQFEPLSLFTKSFWLIPRSHSKVLQKNQTLKYNMYHIQSNSYLSYKRSKDSVTKSLWLSHSSKLKKLRSEHMSRKVLTSTLFHYLYGYFRLASESLHSRYISKEMIKGRNFN